MNLRLPRSRLPTSLLTVPFLRARSPRHLLLRLRPVLFLQTRTYMPTRSVNQIFRGPFALSRVSAAGFVATSPTASLNVRVPLPRSSVSMSSAETDHRMQSRSAPHYMRDVAIVWLEATLRRTILRPLFHKPGLGEPGREWPTMAFSPGGGL